MSRKSMPITLRSDSILVRLGALGAAVVGLLCIAAAPIMLQIYQLNQLTDALILATAILGLNLMTGFGGQISLGHSAFFGLGAYTTGVLVSKYGWNPALTFPVALAVCFLVGMALAGPALRLKGLYLALVTLTFAVLFPGLVRRFDGLTGGSLGITGLSFEPPGVQYFAGRDGGAKWLYWSAIALLVCSFFVVSNLMRSRIGRAILALRENETPAVIAGMNRAAIRTAVFGISAAITGFAGSLYGLKQGILVPDSFNILLAILLLAGMVLGGRATLLGPVVGGLAIFYIPEWTRDLGNGHFSEIIFGVVMILFAFLLPNGIVGGFKSLLNKFVLIEPSIPGDDESDLATAKHGRRGFKAQSDAQ